MKDNKKREVVAGIDIGSHSIKMKIAEINNDGEVRTLENLRRAALIGSDTFTTGKVNLETVYEICEILNGYKQLMKEYDITTYRVVGTTALREAENKDFILEQIKLRTGLDIEVVSNSQVKYLTYKSIREKVKDYKKFRREGALIVDVGSGSTEISVYNTNKLLYSQSIRIGSLRIKEILSSLERRTLDFPKILEEFVEGQIDGLRIFRTKMQIQNFIAIGGEISIISKICNNSKETISPQNIDKEKFIELYNELMYKPTNLIVSEYKISYDRADLLLPSMIIFKKFLDKTLSQDIHAPLVSLRDGVISDIVDKKFNTYRHKEFTKDILSSARYLAKMYKSDMTHIGDVEKKSLLIFDGLQKIHGLGEEERMLLQIAAILHDTGKFINLAKHHKDSYNIIMSSDIMGISREQQIIIANVAKYHSYDIPSISDTSFKMLSKANRMIVCKLVAMLRMADALDRSHKQKVKDIKVTLKNKKVILNAEVYEDALLETWTFESNSEYFKEVFGVIPILKTKKGE